VKVLVLGAAGQIGRALMRSVPSGVDAIGAARELIDIGNAPSVLSAVTRIQPDLIINAAAYTAVDKAESDSELARLLNADAPAAIADAAYGIGARLIHISTDFVFDGTACMPYSTDAQAAPLSVYGATKLAGERAVIARMGDAGVIVRTAWVYDSKAKNFLNTMLRLMTERGAVRVVDDQVGTPTAASSVADIIWRMAATPEAHGIYHWTDAGVASWYDFAVAIADEAEAQGLIARAIEVAPITTQDYPTPARRPSYSVLDKRRTVAQLKSTPIHWRKQLRAVMGELKSA
jgi:dTDP-4-dehydrorhamnose reductase